jgi:hypothetical protein
MERDRAVAVVHAVLSMGESLNLLHELVERNVGDASRKEFRACIGSIMATLNADILFPIIAEYPDLDPDK